jgi:signal transduction histidine kinase
MDPRREAQARPQNGSHRTTQKNTDQFLVCLPAVSSYRPGMWPIIRNAFAEASPAVRRLFRWIVVFWVLLVILQAWDSRNGEGAAGVAEFASAILGASGAALLGLAHTLNLTMQEIAERRQSMGQAAALQQVLLALPALGFAAGVMLGAAAALMMLRAMLGAELPLAMIGTILYSAMLLFAAMTVMQSTRTLFTHATQHAALAAEARSEAAAAQVAALQSQMNPHFLFNALNTVASLVRSDPRAAEHVVENLSDVLRRTLERSSGTSGTVREEVDYVRAYLALEQERWGERLRVAWHVDGEALDEALPPLLLQPLVENALRHGLGARLDGGQLRISVEGTGDTLTLAVEDDGPGFARDWHEGTGLGNLRQRLHTLYAGAGSVTVAAAGSGARVAVSVPRQRAAAAM